MISGLQKMTLLDYPGKVACTVFLQGCNFRCPFCHNTDLLSSDGEEFMTNDEFLDFLKKRQGLIDAVCVSGGEPTLYPDLRSLIKNIKELGFAVKLDTNGSRPEILKKLVYDKLIDYVAMDIKNSPSRYAQTCGVENCQLRNIEESIRFLTSDEVDYEFRTTVVKELHDETCIDEMGKWLYSITQKKPRAIYLQQFVDRDSVLYAGLTPPSHDVLQKYREILSSYVENAYIRGE